MQMFDSTMDVNWQQILMTYCDGEFFFFFDGGLWKYDGIKENDYIFKFLKGKNKSTNNFE